MAWVRFPDGSRRKVERITKADAQRDLDQLVALRAQSVDPGPRREKLASFAEVIESWFAADCPNSSPTAKSRHLRVKSPNTIANAHQLLGTSVLPAIGRLRVDRTSTERLEQRFAGMVEKGYATSTIDRNWNYLNQACQHALRTDQDQPGSQRSPAGGTSVEAPQELHHRTGTAAAGRGHPGRQPPGHVADRAHVRPTPRRAGRTALVLCRR